MKYALVILEYLNESGYPAENAWVNATVTAKDRTAKSGKVVPLNAGCFLCDLDSGLLDLNIVVGVAANYGIQTRTLFFEKEPAFVITKKSS